MPTITETRETRKAQRPPGHLQAKIDAELFDRIGLLAARRTAQEGKRIYPRDLVEEALEKYLPTAERAVELAAKARG